MPPSRQTDLGPPPRVPGGAMQGEYNLRRVPGAAQMPDVAMPGTAASGSGDNRTLDETDRGRDLRRMHQGAANRGS